MFFPILATMSSSDHHKMSDFVMMCVCDQTIRNIYIYDKINTFIYGYYNHNKTIQI